MMNLKRTYPYISVMLEALEVKKQTKKQQNVILMY